MTSASHGKAKRRVWLCAAERTAKRRKSSSGRKNKSRTSRTTPDSSSRSPLQLRTRAPDTPGPLLRRLPPLPRRCSATCPTRSPWLRASLFPRGQGSPAGSRSPAPPLPCRPRPARTAGRGRWRRTAAARPGRLGPAQKRPEAGEKERVSPARAPQPAPDSSYLGRRGGRRGHQHGASATSAAQLRPSARVTSSPALPARGGPRHGSGWALGSGPMVSASHGHTPSVGLGGGHGAVRGMYLTGQLFPPYSAPKVPSCLVRDYNITSVAPAYPELIISSSVPRQDTGCRHLLGHR